MSTGGQYPIAQSIAEWQRLELQHEAWTRNIGYLIHPQIEESLSSTPCIAEIATGTGHFLLDMARKFPESPRIDGFDITSAQFPSDVPRNMTFTIHDTKKPFPAEFHGKYDFVHLRLLITAMDSEDWSIVLSNTVQLLKPGGAVQWVEPGSLSAMALRGHSVMQPQALNRCNDYFKEGLKHRLKHDHLELPAIFTKHGLQNVVQDIVASDNDPTTRAAITTVTCNGYMAFIRYSHDQGVAGAWSLEEIETVRREWEREMACGAYIRVDIYITVGFKKGNSDLET